jgi:ABC-type branched-subunit amino acid transport system substrate-binding protein
VRHRGSTQLAVAVVAALTLGACSGERPRLSAEAPPTATPEPTATLVVAPTPVPTATPLPTPTPVVVASTRGVTATAVRIGVVGTTAVFGGMGDGTAARVGRANSAGGVGGRQLEIVERIDDGGDPAANLDALRQLVEDDQVFAVVVVSSGFGPESAAYLEAQGVPFVGWGITGAFCAPAIFGIGFSGCLNGFALGVPDAAPNPAFDGPLRTIAGDDATMVLVTSADTAGDAAAVEIEELWGDQLAATVRVDPANPDDTVGSAVLDELTAATADLVLVRAGTATTRLVNRTLRDAAYTGIVVDDVSYVPGLLADATVAADLEGAYVLAPVPPQEDLAAATQQVAADLAAVGAAGADPATYQLSLGNSLGYWSTDLLVAALGAVGPELDTARWVEVVGGEGFTYDPDLAGGPCSAAGADLDDTPAGGAAVLRVSGGVYVAAVAWAC